MREKVIMLCVQGYSSSEIAQMLGANLNSVYTIVSRNREAIKDLKGNLQSKQLKIVNEIFNANPIVLNENRLAAY